MKDFIRGLIPALIIVIAFGALPLKAEVTQLSNTPGQADLPFIHVMKDGNLMVLFSEGHHYNSDAILYYTVYDQGKKSWSNPVKAVNKLRSSAFGQIAEDEDGNLHVAYMDGNSSANRDIYYIKYDFASKNWGSRHLVYQSAGLNSTWPRIHVEDGKIYITWGHNYSQSGWIMDICMVVNDIGGKWPVDKQERKTISGDPASTSIHQFSQVHNKNVYCVWMDDHHKVSNWNIYFSEGIYNSNVDDWNWSNPIRVSSSANSQYYPSITVDDEGNPHVFFSNKKNPVWHARRAGNNWIAPKIISTGTAELSLFSFSRFKQGLLHTVVRQHSGSDEGVFYVRGLPDGTFAEPVKVADANFPEYPGLDIDNAGNVHIVWSDGSRGHPRNIFYTKVELPGTPPVAKINISETAGLIPFTVNFDASESYDEDGNIIDYRWSFGDGANAKGKNVSHTYTQKGTFTVVLSVIDSDMRVGTDQVEIVASTGEPFALFEPSATMGMAPFTVELDASNSKDADGEIVSYSWDFGDGVAGDGVVVTHTYATGGTFAVKLTVTDNDGKTGTSTRTITVYQKPTACFTATPDFGKPPLAVSFDASCSSDVDGTIQSYKWDFGDGLSGSAMKITHTYSTPGNLMAVLTVEDNDGYTGTTTLEIKVLDKPLAPLNVRRNTVSNKSLFFNEYINEITWEENPGNSGLFTVINYRIYRRTLAEDDAQFTLVGEAGAGELIYRDRNFSNAQEADNYVYAVTAVDDESNESDYSDYTK